MMFEFKYVLVDKSDARFCSEEIRRAVQMINTSSFKYLIYIDLKVVQSSAEKPIKKKTSDFQTPTVSADASTGRNVMSYDHYKDDNLAERIIADSNELPVSFLEQGYKMQKCVARVNIAPSFGTGFLISPSILMTNNHVLPTKEEAAGARIEFNYQRDLQGNELDVDSYTTNPDALFYTNPETNLDFTIVRINNKQGPPGNNWGYCSLKQVPIAEKQYCNIIQHPNAGFKQVALQENHLVKILDSKVRYETDTEPGSSGSAVFDNTWRIIALHHAAGDRDPQDPDKWLNNEGINIANIIADLKSHFQGDSTGKSILTELGLSV